MSLIIRPQKILKQTILVEKKKMLSVFIEAENWLLWPLLHRKIFGKGKMKERTNPNKGSIIMAYVFDPRLDDCLNNDEYIENLVIHRGDDIKNITFDVYENGVFKRGMKYAYGGVPEGYKLGLIDYARYSEIENELVEVLSIQPKQKVEINANIREVNSFDDITPDILNVLLLAIEARANGLKWGLGSDILISSSQCLYRDPFIEDDGENYLIYVLGRSSSAPSEYGFYGWSRKYKTTPISIKKELYDKMYSLFYAIKSGDFVMSCTNYDIHYKN
jgi:hypothetical protein